MKYFVCRKFCELCNLRTSCELRSLIFKDFLTFGSSHAEVRSKLLRTCKYLYKSSTYENFMFACRPLSLREREVNTAYAGLPLVESSLLLGQGGAA